MSSTTQRSGTSREHSSGRSDDRLATARTQMARALSLEGYAQDGIPVCPNCHKAAKGKAKLFEDGGFKCHACGYYVYNAVDFLTRARVRHAGQIIGQAVRVDNDVVLVRSRSEELTLPRGSVELEGGAWAFAQAVDALCGAEVPHPEGKQPLQVIAVKPQFKATPDWELYAAACALASVDAAEEFYGRWYIDPVVVQDSKAAVVTDHKAFLLALRDRFGPERIIASGMATAEGYPLVNNRYPVIEPHLLPDGRVAGLQFRASEATERDIAAHKAYKAAVERGETPAKKVDYVPKFLSLVGADLAMRPGFGLHRLQRLIDSGDHSRMRRVYIVEGFKDVLAARTLGLEAYGLAGAANLPVVKVCKILSHFDEVHVALDGDAAGEEGTEKLLRYLRDNAGLNAIAHPPPPGMDITDVLVEKNRGTTGTDN